MAKKPGGTMKPTGLRRQAEELLRTTKRDVTAMPVKNVQQLLHELQIHQIELETQNDELRRTQVELETARDRYVALYDFSPAGHLTLNLHGKIVEANLRAGTMLGINRKKLIGQTFATFIASDDQDIFHRHCQDVLKTGTRQACEVHLREGTGAFCCVYFQSLALHDETGHITHWRTALLDVSDRKLAEEVVSAHRAQLDAIISSAMDAIITVDEGERVVVFNRAAESMFLCQATEVMGQPFERFIPERFRQAHHDHINLFAQRQSTSRSMGRPGELFGLRVNGEEFPVDASISHVLVGGKKLLTVILRDITERKISEDRLNEKQRELECLATKLIEAQEEERRKISRELHDDFNQRLAALSVDLECLQRDSIASPLPVAQRLATIRGMVDCLSKDMHDLAYKLHPSLLEHVGLESAARDHVAQFAKRTGLPVTFIAREVPKVLSQEVATNLFRVMQESLQNVSKHAQATDVTVRLSASPKGIGLSVRDNGKGFNCEGRNDYVKGLGLVSMQERARGLGGFLRIHSLPRAGTKVCAWIPHFREGA
ncbi:MAG: PAS domain S-box protein [Nitrospirae bacterium]|nr:PAS domain S-box protein [Nitrospirota bacterium]